MPIPAPSPAPRTAGRRRGRALWLLVGLIAVVCAGLVIFWVTSLNVPDDASNAQPSTSAPSTSAEPTAEEPPPSAEPSAPETSAEPTPEPTPEVPADPLSAASITAFLGDYHQQVLSDPRAAYARTGPTLRANIGEADYVDYWGQFSDVRISDIQAVDGQTTATASLELVYRDGTSESGLHQFTFLVRDGRLILDSDFPA